MLAAVSTGANMVLRNVRGCVLDDVSRRFSRSFLSEVEVVVAVNVFILNYEVSAFFWRVATTREDPGVRRCFVCISNNNRGGLCSKGWS